MCKCKIYPRWKQANTRARSPLCYFWRRRKWSGLARVHMCTGGISGSQHIRASIGSGTCLLWWPTFLYIWTWSLLSPAVVGERSRQWHLSLYLARLWNLAAAARSFIHNQRAGRAPCEMSCSLQTILLRRTSGSAEGCFLKLLMVSLT